MADWIEQYSAALEERDTREQAHKLYIDAFTRVADRAAASSKQSSPSSPPPSSKATSTKGRKSPATSPPPSPNDLITNLRNDLSTTQKARTALQAQIDDLTTSLQTLGLQHKASTAQIKQLTRQKADAERRLRDREEEIRGKGRLVTEAQDEMVALGLQLNMAEQKAEKLQQDNKELLDRWMRAKGEEADRMNRDSRWE